MRIHWNQVASLLCVAVPLVSGCNSEVGDEDLGSAESGVTNGRKGVDYAFDRPSSPKALRDAGITFAARYLSYDNKSTHAKLLSASEAKGLRAAGIDIVSNWEFTTGEAKKGFEAGKNAAVEADKQARAAGMPAGRPIYFSVDFDATPGDQTEINKYFDGIISVIGVKRTGAYGGYYVIKRLFDAKKIVWGWQTYAWSGGQWDSRAQLRQVKNGVTVAGADCDLDTAVAQDFGQWGGSGGGGGGGGASSCHSDTLDADVPEGACVQSASDAEFYTCRSGDWEKGKTDCKSTYAFCYSQTLDKDVPIRSCVQSKVDKEWYQCTMAGWSQPVSDGKGSAGTCSTMIKL